MELGRPARRDPGQCQPPRQGEPDAHSNALAIAAPMIRRCRLLCQCRLVHGVILTGDSVPNVQLRPAVPWTQGQATDSRAYARLTMNRQLGRHNGGTTRSGSATA